MIESIVKILLASLKQDELLKHHHPYSRYVREFRTVGLTLPRQSGKTKFLLSYHDRKSSLLFFHNHTIKTCVGRGSDSSTSYFGLFERLGYASALIGSGAKYECFLLDESEFMTEKQEEEFDAMLERYHRYGLLSEDFYVLKLST